MLKRIKWAPRSFGETASNLYIYSFFQYQDWAENLEKKLRINDQR